MQKLKKYSVLILILTVSMLAIDILPSIVTQDGNYTAVSAVIDEGYKIYNLNGELINTSQICEVGDMFISGNNILYEIYEIDEINKIAYAKAKIMVQLPKVKNIASQFIQISGVNKKICMYHTHNAESYVLGDGYDSIYGKGGIMDIGAKFLTELNKLGISVYRSENLHLPHDTYAYTRSRATANSLISQYSPQAIFDVHRDGVPRSQYLSSVNGKTTSSIRMVIGKSNSNFASNLDFALAIKAYADKNYPGLIKDIYMGKGHYNQALMSTAILFEMGTYLIEKDYVISSIPYLADTIDKVMYTTAVEAPGGDESIGEIITNNSSSENSNTNNENNSDNIDSNQSAGFDILALVLMLLGGGFVVIITYAFLKFNKKKRN